MAKSKKIDKLIREFAEKVFKLHPDMMGVNVCGVQPNKKYDKVGDLRVRGVYVENKNFKEVEGKE